MREPLETVDVDRERRWKIGRKVTLSAFELAEIWFMANHNAIDVLNALRDFGLRHGLRMKAAEGVRGGEQDESLEATPGKIGIADV